MQEINVKLWRNHQQQDWSIEIDGKRYESVTIDMIEELMERALIDAEGSVLAVTAKRAT